MHCGNHDAAFLAQPTVDGVTGDSLNVDPTTAVERYDWDTVAAQAESVYRRAIDDQW